MRIRMTKVFPEMLFQLFIQFWFLSFSKGKFCKYIYETKRWRNALGIFICPPLTTHFFVITSKAPFLSLSNKSIIQYNKMKCCIF